MSTPEPEQSASPDTTSKAAADPVNPTPPCAKKAPLEATPDYIAQLCAHRIAMLNTGDLMIDEFAKAIMTLSGAAIGISMTFAKDLLKLESILLPGLMVGSWVLWASALGLTVIAYYTSHLAHGKAVKKFDELFSAKRYMEISKALANIVENRVTQWLSRIGGLFFFAGLILMLVFVYKNFTYGRAPAKTGSTNATPASSSSTTTTVTTVATTITTTTTNSGAPGRTTTGN